MKRVKFRIAVALLLLIVVFVGLFFIPSRETAEFKRVVRAVGNIPPEDLEASVQSFVRDRRATNGVVPRTVLLSELVSERYLQSNQTHGLEGRDVYVSVDWD